MRIFSYVPQHVVLYVALIACLRVHMPTVTNSYTMYLYATAAYFGNLYGSGYCMFKPLGTIITCDFFLVKQ